MLFNPLPSILRLGFALLGLALLATYGWSLSHQDVPMDLLARQQPPSLMVLDKYFSLLKSKD
jgi:peptide/nickel transport system permease protein